MRFSGKRRKSKNEKRDKTLNSNQAIWNIVYDEILKKYPEAVIELWFKNFELEYFDDERA